MKFSQRMGITPSSKVPQIDSMDNELLSGLWNVFHNGFLVGISPMIGTINMGPLTDEQIHYANALWHDFLKADVSKIPHFSNELHYFLNQFIFKKEWYHVLDFIEYSVNYVRVNEVNGVSHEVLEEQFNIVLEREISGYRFINGHLAPITNKYEINELTESLTQTESFTALKGCNIHLQSALQKLSDRGNPDYRNSIKESISAVESLAKLIAQRPGDSLGASLDRIKGVINLHPSLERGFKQIYGYTSDEGGIRHALMDSPNCDFEDAKFMLISCSAFINYLIVKANKAGIEFQNL
ncbi:AbiJ-NTD4 domain-containing protein [Chitinophaga sp. GbtcB8]|uniref:AbiJ-NTD4 domain-containing protein n=1 Tax=Chitinophaga sp. GbtcB8 TaxID=2824753 RepID=UPI001C3057A5|nr:hypothetical protein [Chitinophaga sp. GbtcB8]